MRRCCWEARGKPSRFLFSIPLCRGGRTPTGKAARQAQGRSSTSACCDRHDRRVGAARCCASNADKEGKESGDGSITAATSENAKKKSTTEKGKQSKPAKKKADAPRAADETKAADQKAKGKKGRNAKALSSRKLPSVHSTEADLDRPLPPDDDDSSSSSSDDTGSWRLPLAAHAPPCFARKFVPAMLLAATSLTGTLKKVANSRRLVASHVLLSFVFSSRSCLLSGISGRLVASKAAEPLGAFAYAGFARAVLAAAYPDARVRGVNVAGGTAPTVRAGAQAGFARAVLAAAHIVARVSGSHVASGTAPAARTDARPGVAHAVLAAARILGASPAITGSGRFNTSRPVPAASLSMRRRSGAKRCKCARTQPSAERRSCDVDEADHHGNAAGSLHGVRRVEEVPGGAFLAEPTRKSFSLKPRGS